MGTASVGPDYGATELEQRIERLRPADQLVILADLQVGQKGAGNPEHVRMDMEQHMGEMYPFSNAQKLQKISESHPYYDQDSPWGKPVVPLEMVSVLTQYTSGQSGFRSRGPAIGLFAGQQIKMLNGPLLIGEDYLLEREIIALSESRRTESNWILSRVYRASDKELVAEAILNSATLKDSYANYDADAAALGKDLSA